MNFLNAQSFFSERQYEFWKQKKSALIDFTEGMYNTINCKVEISGSFVNFANAFVDLVTQEAVC